MNWKERSDQLIQKIKEFNNPNLEKFIDVMVSVSLSFDGIDHNHIDEELREKIHPERREKVKSLIIEKFQLSKELKDHLDSQRYWLSGDRDLAEEVRGEVVISHANIIIECFEFIPGFKEILPSGGDYLGKGQWKYPLSKESELMKIGFPVIRYPN